MAWTTPVTDRINGQTRTTADDMNRIDGNINYLWATLLRTDFSNSSHSGFSAGCTTRSL